MSQTLQQTKRIEYIDCIKGFTILWVVLIHFGEIMPSWCLVEYRMPLFFFMSGLFFRQRPFKVFFIRRINTLIIPLLFFYVLSVALLAIKYEVFTRLFPSIDYIRWGSFSEYALAITKLAQVSLPLDYSALIVNPPLWFLIVLFNIQMIYYGLMYVLDNRWLVFAVCCACYALSVFLVMHHVNGLFYCAKTMQFIVYYGAGEMLGMKLIKAIDRFELKSLAGIFVLLSGTLYALSLWHAGNTFFGHLLLNLCILIFIPSVFAFFKMTYKFPGFEILIFFGKNSLTVLGVHLLIFSVFATVVVKFMKLLPLEKLVDTPVYYVALFAVVLSSAIS